MIVVLTDEVVFPGFDPFVPLIVVAIPLPLQCCSFTECFWIVSRDLRYTWGICEWMIPVETREVLYLLNRRASNHPPCADIRHYTWTRAFQNGENLHLDGRDIKEPAHPP